MREPSGNELQSEQTGDINLIDTIIGGNDNLIAFVQEGNSNVIAGDEGSFIVGGNGGSVDIQQVGNNNVVTGGQFSDSNTMSVYQQGDYNVATVVQY